MIKKQFYIMVLLLISIVSYSQDVKMAVSGGGKNMPKFTEEERQQCKSELNRLFKLPHSKKNDSLIYRNYSLLCTNYVFINKPDSLLKFALQFKNIALENNDKFNVMQALFRICDAYGHPKNKNPFKFHQTRLEQLELLNSPIITQKYGIKGGLNKETLRYFVNFYVRRDEFQLAKQLLDKYKSVLHPDDFDELQAFAKTGKADLRFSLRNYQERILELQKRPNYKISDMWNLYAFGAGNYNSLNMPDSAIIYAQKAFDIAKQPNGNPFPLDKDAPEESYNWTLTKAYFLKKEYEKANSYLQKVWNKNEKYNATDNLLAYDINKALGKHSEALSQYENYIKEKSKTDSLNRIKSVEYLQIGFETEKIKFEGEQKQLLMKQRTDSVLNLKQLEVLKILNIKSNLEREAILKSLSFEQLQATSLKQSLENQKIVSKSQRQDGQIKRLKINELNQQIAFQNRTRNYLGFGIGLLSLLGISLLWYNRKLNGKNKDLVTKNEIIKDITYKIQTTEITALRAQMNPHFIFNCLNSIQLFTAQNNPDKASEYLTKFSRLIRLVLDNSKTDKISLTNELETLKLYIEMESMRFRGKVKHEINIADDVDVSFIQIPPLLIQPFVENAIWHGLMHKEEGGTIKITISQPKETLLKVEITDDGIGREKAMEYKSKSATKHKSYGMKITAERIELINQMYQTNTNVKVEDIKNDKNDVNGTKVIIEIPI
jgi:Histidine kinase